MDPLSNAADAQRAGRYLNQALHDHDLVCRNLAVACTLGFRV